MRLINNTLTAKIAQELLKESNTPNKKFDESSINESKEFVDSLDRIADFMIGFDTYEFEDSYDGDYDSKRDALIQDIASGKDAVIAYLQDIVSEELGTEEQQVEAKEILNTLGVKLNEELKANGYGEFDVIAHPSMPVWLSDFVFIGVNDTRKFSLWYKSAYMVPLEPEYIVIRPVSSYSDKLEELVKEVEHYNLAYLFTDEDRDYPVYKYVGGRTWKSLNDYGARVSFDDEDFFTKVTSIALTQGVENKAPKIELESVEQPTPEDLEKDDKEILLGSKKEIEDRIGELKMVLLDEPTNVDKEMIVKEIEELEAKLDECNTLKEGNVFQDAPLVINDLINKAKTELSKEDLGDFLQGIVDNVKQVAEELNILVESVCVSTVDGSNVCTSNAASVCTDECSVTVATDDTTVTITKDCVEPANDLSSEGEIDALPEPTEELPSGEVSVEEPEVIEESTEEDGGMDIVVDATSLSVVKNQGIVYMLQIKETDGSEKYWVVDNFDSNTNTSYNCLPFDTKEAADEEYFKRVGVETTEVK